MNYEYLEKMSAKSYLNPDKFKTSYDKEDQYAIDQYNKGIEIGSQYGFIYINHKSIWQTGNTAATEVSSLHEGIGVHKSTKDLLKGFLDSGANIVVQRMENKNIKSYLIQKGDIELISDTQSSIINKLTNDDNSKQTVIGLRPLEIESLTSQINNGLSYKNIQLSDLKFNNELFSYQYIKDNNTFTFILSNSDISKQNTIKKIQSKNDIDENASISFIDLKNTSHYWAHTMLKTNFENKSLKLYIQPKQYEKDIQIVFCKIERGNDFKRKSKKISQP